MADGVKNYIIKINGISQATDEAKNLLAMLDKLEAKMKEFDGKGVSIGGRESTSNLSEQEKIYNRIAALEERIEAAKDKNYAYEVKLKDELKQVKVEQEAVAAAAKLQEDAYDKTSMAGMKEELKDTLRVLNTLDTGSTQFEQLNEKAKELTYTLRELEKSRGSFGRGVGDYASAAEGFDKLRIQVGNTTREFDNAREALKSLKNERDTLALMGKDFKDIDLVVKQLQSSIKDMSASSAGMDNLLDTMQSIIAISSTAKGIGAVFGMDNDKIEETIKKLVALQNVMQGIETIQKQIQTQEGIGKWLANGSRAIDSFTTKMFGATKAVEGTATAMKTATTTSKAFSVALKGLGIGLIISLIVSLTQKWDKINNSINKSFPALEKFGGILGVIEGAINGVINAMGNMIDILKALIRLDFSEIGNIISQSFSDGFQEVADEQKRIAAEAAAEELKIQMDMLEAKYGNEIKYTAQYKKLLDERNKLLAQSYNPNTKEGKKQQSELEVQMAKEEKAYKDHAKEMAKQQREADAELTSLRISNMKNGLNKTLLQLEEERKARINKARETGRNVREAEAEINRYYNTQEQKAREQYQSQVVESYRKMYNDIANLRAENERQILSNMESELNNTLNQMESQKFDIIGNGFGTGWGRERTDKSMFTYGIDIDYKTLFDDETIGKILEYKPILQELVKATDELSAAEEHLKGLIIIGDESGIEYWQKEVDKLKEAKEAAEDARISFEKLYGGDIAKMSFIDEGNKDEAKIFKQRISTIEDFYKTYADVVQDSYDRILEQEKQSLRKEKEVELSSLKERLRAFSEENSQAMEDELNSAKWTEEQKLEIQKKYQEIYRQYYQQYATQRDQIIQKYGNAEIEAEQKRSEKIKSIYEKQFQDLLTEMRDFETRASRALNGYAKYNNSGILNIKETRERIEKARVLYRTQLSTIGGMMSDLNDKWKNGLISDEVYQNTSRELNGLVETTQEGLTKLTDASKNILGAFVESIQPYTQAFSQTLSGILQAVWDIQDSAYEREKEDLEKQTEVLEEQLDKQKELTEKYKDDVDSIEDELSTARGDRRQELIDQLNAEKAAQRASLAEEKRIEREKEKLEEKAEKLDEEQRKKQKERDLITASINASMAILGAAANHWMYPALPLVAAATALGAAQIAAIKSKKYASGGVIDGPRHIRGGVKVLGGRAEVEGGEYITNRQTTMKNVELLEYINAKKKRIDLQDMVEFFDSGARRTIKSISPARKFEEGGALPLLNNDITINDKLLMMMDKYSNRPVVVSVTEINQVQDDLRQVQALAGVDAEA